MSSSQSSSDEICTIDPYERMHIALNPDGTLTRMELPKVPSTTEDDTFPSENVASKDVTINADTKTWMRIYLPKNLPSNENNEEDNVDKLPIIIYFHLGMFLVWHADTMFANEQCGRYASELPAIVASVSYRLAPEHRLPAAYEDAIDALMWIKKQALDTNGDPWLRDHGDFSRILLMGLDAGANIAYRAALLAQEVDLGPLRISGLLISQPFFAGTKKTESEIRGINDSIMSASMIDLSSKLALPVGSDKDHEYFNPLVEGKYSKYIKSLPRVLVRGFQGDPLLDRQMHFVNMLVDHGVPVTGHFGEIGFHCTDVFDAKRHLHTIKYIKDFM